MKVLGALDRPNSLINHSYSPSFVLKVVFHSSTSKIRIWWYPLPRLFFENNLDPADISNISNISSKCGIGNRYLTVIQLIALLSIPMSWLPSFFACYNSTYTINRLMLSLMNPFVRSSLIFSLIFSSSCELIQYYGRLRKLASSIKSIWYWISLIGGKLLGNFLDTNSPNYTSRDCTLSEITILGFLSSFVFLMLKDQTIVT